MTPAEAAWVADVVITRRMLQAYSPRETCACQSGLCHYCREGHREPCVIVRWGGAPPAVCETWITDRQGRVVTGSPDVWRAGRPCRWICPCTSCPPSPAPPPAAAEPVVMQLDIFGALLDGAR